MRISELAGALGLESAQGNFQDRAISSGYSSDLLSDVMANAASDAVLVTVQAHKNAVAVASLVGLAAIVICNGRSLPPDMVEAAKIEGIGLFRTAANAFEVSGRLWAALRASAAAPGSTVTAPSGAAAAPCASVPAPPLSAAVAPGATVSALPSSAAAPGAAPAGPDAASGPAGPAAPSGPGD